MADGIVNIMKPPGMTSHDVVNQLRKIYHTKKVGHTGTLDPNAIGVLPICVGQATRLAEYLTEKDKRYKVVMNFGRETDSGDAWGNVLEQTEMSALSRDAFVERTKQFIGDIEQIPPIYSAIKKDGQPLYKLAREGKTVELEPRRVTIYAIDVLMYNGKSAMMEVHCGKGTYIRSLCRDLGRACGSSAYMTYLMRLSSGHFSIEDAIQLQPLSESSNPEKYLLPIEKALPDMLKMVIEDELVCKRIANGLSQKIDPKQPIAEGTICQLHDKEEHLLAIGIYQKEAFQPQKVFKVGDGR